MNPYVKSNIKPRSELAKGQFLKSECVVRLLLLSVYILMANYAFATTYYVAANGDDANDGLSVETAWQTIDKVKSVVLIPGDQILFHRGDIFRGSLTIKGSGEEGNPIILGAYGDGEKPIISGATLNIEGWEDAGNGIWRINYPVPEGKSVNQIFVNGKLANISRYPNSGYFYVDSKISGVSFSDAEVLVKSPEYYAGSKLCMRSKDWSWSNQSVSSINGSTILCENFEYDSPDKGEGYYFYGNVNMIDIVGEWAYRDGFVYFMPPNGVHPSTLNIEISYPDWNYVLLLTKKKYITVRDLTFEKGNEYGIHNMEVSDMVFDNLTIRNMYTGCFQVYSSGSKPYNENLLLTGCDISDSFQRGLWINRTINSLFTKSTIKRIGTVDGYFGLNAARSSSVYSATGYSNTYSKLVVDSVGKTGFSITDKHNIVEKNLVSNCGITTSDYGAIYVIGTNADSNLVRNNFLFDNHCFLGAHDFGGSRNTFAYRGAGVYSDGCNEGSLFYNNTSYHNDYGIKNITGRGTIIRGNVVYNNSSGVSFQELPSNLTGAGYPKGWSTNNELVGNTIYMGSEDSQKSSSVMISFWTTTVGNNLLTKSDSNRFINPYLGSKRIGIQTYRNSSGVEIEYEEMNFAYWKNKYNDQYSKISYFSFTESNPDRSELFLNMSDDPKTYTLEGTWYDLDGNVVSNELVVEPWYSTILVRGGGGVGTYANQLDDTFSTAATIYPNPAKEWLHFSFKEPMVDGGMIRIYSLTGQLKLQKRVTTDALEYTIPVSSLARGMYLVQVLNSQNQLVYRSKQSKL